MKKIAIATLIALAATASYALEVGVNATREYVGANSNGSGLWVGNQYGAIKATVGFERFTKEVNNQDRLSVSAGYDVANFANVTITPKVSLVHLNNSSAADGFAMTVGVGASVGLTKNVNFNVDLRRQYGQDRVQAFDGNAFSAGISYKF